MKKLLLIGASVLFLAACSEENSDKASAATNYGNGYDIEYVKHLTSSQGLYKDTNGCYWIGNEHDTLTQVMETGRMQYGYKNTIPMCDE